MSDLIKLGTYMSGKIEEISNKDLKGTIGDKVHVLQHEVLVERERSNKVEGALLEAILALNKIKNKSLDKRDRWVNNIATDTLKIISEIME